MTPIFGTTLIVSHLTRHNIQSFCSLGCGIGYGYLHRIPVRGSPVPPASHNPSRPLSVPTSSSQSPAQQAVVAPVLPTQEGNIVTDVSPRPIIAAQEMVILCYITFCIYKC